MRVHSNEFRGAQSASQRTLTLGNNSRQNHRYSQPSEHSLPLPLLAHTPPPLPASHGASSSLSSQASLHSESPPPLPSPRGKVKAITPPIAPKVFPKLPNPQTLPLSASSSSRGGVQAKQLPGVPTLVGSHSESLLDIDMRPPAPLPNDVRNYTPALWNWAHMLHAAIVGKG